ncbi:hypothetical protein ASPBRDRAFT_130939 [Aspergillus brasiliensis CBS 101740]|uniref:Uncharacterized protein n=1 Tax=Aspergillus brasiliensis (strain CBS 101740 / IMI 381727 / IBT 21946) TaxID=767769 RepID=A0A1L9UCR8_ASPBC|nr:hypothetical protein ASPBRDRAFT_130939 [Aspergillus brasiliensis CBS 101740]
MNWTGGRLRRHSSYNTSSKKRLLRRSKKAETKDPLTTSLVKNACLHKGGQARDSCDQPILEQSQQSRHESSPSYPTKKPRLASPAQGSQAARDLARIKHKLLEKTDWASVAAARPLRVPFPPVEALQKFGRRRNITNDDHERLGSSDLRPKLTSRRRKHRGTVSDMESIQNLEIRINGQPVGANYPRGCHSPTDATSQSMLLDHDFAPTMPKPFVHEYASENIGVRASVDDRSWILGSSSISPLCVSPSNRELSPWRKSMFQGSNNLDDKYLVPRQSADTSPEAQRACTPIRRRFTIDDQILAEEERQIKAAYDTSLITDNYSTAHRFLQGPSHPRLPPPTANSSRQQISIQKSMSTSSTLNHSSYGWLPEPRHNIQRFISQRTEKGENGKAPSESRLRSTRLALPCTTTKQITTPLIIFGQSVDVDGDLLAKPVDHRDEQQAQPDFTWSPMMPHEAKSNMSMDDYPFKKRNTRRPDDFVSSPNMVKPSKPTIAPRTGSIYIDQACASPFSRTAVSGRAPLEAPGGSTCPRMDQSMFIQLGPGI